MPKKSSIKSPGLSLPSVPAFWPMAMAMRMLEDSAELYMKNLKFIEEEIKIHDELRPFSLRQTKCVSICGPWCCATMESRAEFQRSSTRPMRPHGCYRRLP